jgi:predicted SPOUT superfamily RNA methylase MTH1
VLKGRKVAVAIPDTILEEHDNLREKTVKLGQIARACATFGVDVIVVFRDPKGRGESRLIKRVLEYLETPQYLRKKLFGFDEALRFAGLLPPLRIPSHKPKVALEKLKVGDVREGVVIEDGRAFVGLDEAVKLNQKLPENARVTARITKVSPLTGEVVDRGAVSEYWGYSVEVRSLEEVLSDRGFGLKVATSRYGNSLRSVLGELRGAIGSSSGVMLIFGSPSRGLFDIIGKDLTSRVKFVVNLYEEQTVETVRAEEAIPAGLFMLSLLST